MSEKQEMKFQIIADELCLDFINTLDNRPVPERRRELLGSYEDLADWAVQAGAINATLRAALTRQAKVHPAKARAVVCRAIDLRETLYRIVAGRLTRRRLADADRRALNVALGQALSHLQLRATRKGFRLDWAEEPVSLEAILWPIAGSAGQLLTSGDLGRVRQCGGKTCRWMFVDRSKNHSRRWCDMKVCGNRTKAQKFYQRTKRRSK
jgi:predicted RNA-binding Zn ribbon-like protein